MFFFKFRYCVEQLVGMHLLCGVKQCIRKSMQSQISNYLLLACSCTVTSREQLPKNSGMIMAVNFGGNINRNIILNIANRLGKTVDLSGNIQTTLMTTINHENSVLNVHLVTNKIIVPEISFFILKKKIDHLIASDGNFLKDRNKFPEIFC